MSRLTRTYAFKPLEQTVYVPEARVAYTLCAALEGGSNYWCNKVHIDHWPDGCEYAHEAIARGCPFTVTDDDGEEHNFEDSCNRILKTLPIMQDKYPAHFEDMINENEDADTGDILFQLIVFGEVIYG